MSIGPLSLWVSASALVLLAVTTPSPADERPQPVMLAEETLLSYLPASEEPRVEARLDVDFTGDGLRDSAFVLRGNETRVLKVLVGYATDVDVDYNPAGEMAMDISPLGTAALSAKNGVLIVEDLAGGTSAFQSLYRFRYVAGAGRMRLIGDDVSYYSRTNQHGSMSISTNRLTGARITTESELDGETYVDRPAKRSKVATRPIYMEDAPSPAQTLGFDD